MRRPGTQSSAPTALWLGAALLALPACDLTTANPAPAVSGEWLAVEYVVENTAQPAQTETLVPDAGWFRYITLGTGGYHQDREWSPTGGWTSVEGNWVGNDSILTVSYGLAGETYEWPFELLGRERLRVTVQVAEGYDFNDDGTGDPTTQHLEFVRSENNPADALLAIWTAEAYTFTSVADTSVSYDVVADGGGLSVTFFQAGNYQLAETIPGSDGTVTENGEYAGLEGLLWLIEGDVIEFGTYTASGDTLTIRFERAQWDFDGDGTDEDATVELVLTK